MGKVEGLWVRWKRRSKRKVGEGRGGRWVRVEEKGWGSQGQVGEVEGSKRKVGEEGG